LTFRRTDEQASCADAPFGRAVDAICTTERFDLIVSRHQQFYMMDSAP